MTRLDFVTQWNSTLTGPCELCGEPLTDGRHHSPVVKVQHIEWEGIARYKYHPRCFKFSPFRESPVRVLTIDSGGKQ